MVCLTRNQLILLPLCSIRTVYGEVPLTKLLSSGQRVGSPLDLKRTGPILCIPLYVPRLCQNYVALNAVRKTTKMMSRTQQ